MKRIVVDTNILVRLFARDDGTQWTIAQRLVAENICVILPTVMMETEWVLRSKFRFSREHIVQLFQDLIDSDGIDFPQRHMIVAAVDAFGSGMDFADALHVAGLDEGLSFATFDKDLVRLAKQQFSQLSIELAH